MTQKLLTVIVVVLFSLNTWAADYEEGVHYFELPIAVGVVPDGKIEVTLNRRNAPQLKVSNAYKEMLTGYQVSTSKSKSHQSQIL